MTHSEIENLASEYLEGGLGAAQRAEMEEHLAACSPCREVMGEIRSAIQTCHAAGELNPPPWLIPRIRRATRGERPPGWIARLRALPSLLGNPRFAYGVAMAVFSLSLIANTSGLQLRSLNFDDLNPAMWYSRANRAGHLLYAHAEKFYYDLRIVYEIESRFRAAQARRGSGQAKSQEPGAASEPSTSAGGKKNPQLAGAKLDVPNLAWEFRGVRSDEMRLPS